MGVAESKEYGKEAVFLINGKQYTVDSSVAHNTSLNAFIRDHANLKGTKFMCYEGGCGACIVTLTSVDPVTKKKHSFAVNSCLFPVFSCHGCEVTTVEGIGNQREGHHTVQKTLASFNGTQCGYCSPGMVMNMYSLLQSGKEVTMAEVENSFGGNMCRCTGYRPILDAFKSFAVDAPPELKEKAKDIEDLIQDKMCLKAGTDCCKSNGNKNGICIQRLPLDVPPLHIVKEEIEWFKVDKISDIFTILETWPDKKYILLSGNTAHGVYRRSSDIQTFIDINSVSELKAHSVGTDLVIGGNMSLTEAMNLFNEISKSNSQFSYTKVLADHIDLIANVPVRNTGTLAGNLSIKYEHNDFPSDIYLSFEAADAKINIVDKAGLEQSVSPQDYLNVDMKNKVIKSITFPSYDSSYFFKTYKIMPRAQNAHAYVNAGFLVKLDESKTGQIVSRPRIVFGGINEELTHANKTEEFLEGKNIYDSKVLSEALQILDSELKPNNNPPDATPEYRKGLAEGLFYKFVLSISPESLKAILRSGGQILKRPLSSGKQEFDTYKEDWPLSRAVPKLEGMAQCSGEAQFINDIPKTPEELYCAFVITTVGGGTIKSTDASEALAVSGVVAYYDAKDLPGKNTFTPATVDLVEDEEIFCSGTVKFNGQVVGLIVAESHNTAVQAASLVKVEYESVKKPLIHLRDAVKTGDESRVYVSGEMTATDTTKKKNTKHTIKGSLHIGTQYHYTMETQCALCVPTEDGIDVYAPTQWIAVTQSAIAESLNIPHNSVNVFVRRLGGAYGGKITRNCQIAAAAALAAYLLKKPVRFILPLETNMGSVGKRFDIAIDYEIGTEDDGTITYMDAKTYHNNGSGSNDSALADCLVQIVNCYDNSSWNISAYTVKTDIPGATWFRAPGPLEGIAFVEHMMEHVSHALGLDPMEVRLKNTDKSDSNVSDMVTYWKTKSDFDKRQERVNNFNKENRWRKRGISVVPMRYTVTYVGSYHAAVSIYAADGTVSVCHGGVECGQGINTKVAQVVAYGLGCPLENVNVRPTTNFISPNDIYTGASITSEGCAYAAFRACEVLKQRLAPVRRKMKSPSWTELITQASSDFVDLSATSIMYQGMSEKLDKYFLYGVTIAEVEVDVLTGEYQIIRTDILEDAGESMNPEVDIGQVEGGFVMGLGYWLKEYIVYDEETGKILTTRTWNYKPPGAKDIPIDFRIELRKKSPNPLGVLRSKTTGEPPLCMSVAVFFALREAVLAARKDAGYTDNWIDIAPPATPEKIFLACNTSYRQFNL